MNQQNSKKKQIIVLNPTPPKKREKGISLASSEHIKNELASLYRECRRGDLDVGTGSKLTFMLMSLAKVIEQSDLEQRLEALEAAQENKR